MSKLFTLSLTSIISIFLISPLCLAGGGHESEPTKGPNRGRLLTKDNFAIEVTIFEDNVEPIYRVYAYEKEKLVDPSLVKVSITNDRFLRPSEIYHLSPKENFLTSEKIVAEPHSFKVTVIANYKDKNYEWSYDSYEARTTLSKSALKVAKIDIETALSAKIQTTTEVFGRLLPNEDSVAHVYPRFPGVIKEIRKKLGDTVEKGDVLAVIESNQSLQVYEIKSLISGTIIKRHATLGEYAPENKELFIVADLSEIWADFQVYRDDLPTISTGQQITIQIREFKTPIQATVSYVSPLTDIATQSKLIRAVISNKDQNLRPGLFISGTLSSSSSEVAVAVKREAIQTFRDWNVVYITDGQTFQAIPVELGRQDQEFVEIVSGINAGDQYVSKNSFIIKADVEKSGASHDH